MVNDRILNLAYNNLAPFTYDNDLIESNGTAAKLKLVPNPNQIFEQLFNDDSGFIYDDTKAIFESGLVRQIDKRPVGAVLGHTFNKATNPQNVDWANNSFISTLEGAYINAGKLRCSGDAGLKDVGNLAINGKGAIKMKITPLTTGNPSANQNIFTVQQSEANPASQLWLYHDTASAWRMYGKRLDGSNYMTGTGFNTTVFTAGVAVELLVMWDFTVDMKISLYADGVRLASVTYNPTYGTLGYLKIGGGAGCSFDIDDIVVYNTNPISHIVENYVTGYTLPEYSYDYSVVTLPLFSYSGLGSILSVDSFTIDKVGSPRFTFNDNYWNGTAWNISNGSYDQATTYENMESAILNYPVGGSGDVAVKVIFPDSNTLSSISLFHLELTGQKYPIEKPWIMKAIGTYLDGIGVFSIVSETPANTSLKFISYFNNIPYYFDGLDWVVSNGTEAQSNTLAELNANIGSFDYALGKIFQLKVFLVTTDENVTPLLTSISMTYDFAAAPNYPTVCKMYGFVTNLSGLPVAGADVEFFSSDFYFGNNLVGKGLKVVTDANGYYEADLVITEDLEIQITQKISYKDYDGKKATDERNLIVPNLEVAPIAEHLVA